MLRFVTGLFALLLSVTFLLAEEYRGTFKSVDKGKTKITIDVDGVVKTFAINNPLVLTEKAKAVPKGVLGIKAGTEVRVSTDKKGDKEIATTIRVLDKK